MPRPLFLFALTASLCLSEAASAQWYAAMDMIVPTRRDSSNTVFARGQIVQTVVDADGNPVLDPDGNPIITATVSEDVLASAGNLDVDFEIGGRLTLGRRIGDWAVEGIFLKANDFTSWFSLADPTGQIASPFTPVGAEVDPVLDNNTNVDLAFTSDMEGAELNLFRLAEANCHGEAFCLFGLRYLSVDDFLSYTSTNAGGTLLRDVRTDNDLIGPQFGVVTYSPHKYGMLRIALKGAAAYNRFNKFTSDSGGSTVRALGDRASFIGEFGIGCEFRPIYHMSIRIGYDVFVASDLTLAVENFDAGQAIIAKDAVYHIPYAGLVLKY